MSDELPEGWVAAPLGTLTTKIGSGATPRGGSAAYETAGVPLIRSQNVYFDAFRDDGLVFLNEKQAAALDSVRVDVQDVLLNITGASIGRACLAPDSMRDARVNQHVAIIRPLPASIDPLMLAMYLESPSIQLRINAEEYGVTRQALTKGWIEELEVPIAPLAEQRRIVEKVEALLEQVNRAKARLDRVPLILKRFRQAVLAAACSGELTRDWRENAGRAGDDAEIPASWQCMTVREVASSEPRSIQSGPFGSNLLHSEFREHGRLVIGIDNVADGVFVRGRQHRISESKFRQLQKYQARPLDVLITVMATVGRCCVVPADIEPAIITKHVYRITCNRDVMNPYFLLYVLRGSPDLRGDMRDRIRGQTRPGINGEILKALEVPIPRLDEQIEIVRQVDRLLALADAIEHRVQAATARAAKLPQAILAKAFAGELVPTEAELARAEGRTYETAAELLARVQSMSRPTADRKRARKRARVANG